MKLHVVPARTGLLWVRLGIKTFFRQPLALTGLFFMYMAAMFVLSALPWVGPALAAVLVPGCALGMMAAAQEASRGRFPMPSILISAFRTSRQRLRATLLLGTIYAVGWFLVLMLATLLVPLPAADRVATPETQGQIAGFYLAVTLLHAPLTVLFWHAPALVHWHDISPLKSLFFSAVACFKNFGAFAVYGLAWLVIMMAGGVALGLVGHLLGGPAMVQAVLMPTLLVMAAMFSSSIYFTFRDSFVSASDTPPETPAAGP